MPTYTLCGKTGCCPVVSIKKNFVEIGEKGNLVKLKKSEWKELVRKIKSGEIQ